jgi:hypothetical protein
MPIPTRRLLILILGAAPLLALGGVSTVFFGLAALYLGTLAVIVGLDLARSPAPGRFRVRRVAENKLSLGAENPITVEVMDPRPAGPPLYAGTFYGHPLAFGYETFEPPGFIAARPTLAGFPSPAAFALLREWGVRYVVVAASSYGADWPGTRAYFATLPDWTEATHASQPPTWAAPFWVADVRPELRDLLAPDELVVYRVK